MIPTIKTPTGNEGNCNYFLSESILSLAPLAGGKLLALVRLTESWNDDPEVTRTDLAFYENYHEAAHCLARILDADAELKQEDFLPNVLAAAENNGKLVSTVSGFSIVTLAGAQSVVGDTVGWTYDAFRSALADMPEGCTALDPSTTRTDILNTCLMLDLNHFVDWATGSCSFEGEEFTSLLEFAKTFPAEEKGKDGAENADPFARLMQSKLNIYVNEQR